MSTLEKIVRQMLFALIMLLLCTVLIMALKVVTGA
jgi:hypothetical protein